MFANTPLIYAMQESITKDESLTRDRHLHKSRPKLITNNIDAKNRNDTIIELLPSSTYEGNLLNQSVQPRAQTS